MNKSNKRVQQSIKLICDALLALMEEKALKDISISELCQKAMVSRNTFYRLFGDKEEVLSHILEEKSGYILNQFVLLEDYDLIQPLEQDIIRTYERFFRFWSEQRELLETLRRQNLHYLLDRAFLKSVPAYGKKSYDKLSVPSDPPYYMDYFYFWHAITLSKIIEKWVLRGCTESVEELVAVTIRLHQSTNYKWA